MVTNLIFILLFIDFVSDMIDSIIS